MEMLNMSEINQKPFKEKFIDASIDGEIMRAEERGEIIGIEIKEEEIIKKLLKNNSAKNVASILEYDFEKIQDIKNNTNTTLKSKTFSEYFQHISNNMKTFNMEMTAKDEEYINKSIEKDIMRMEEIAIEKGIKQKEKELIKKLLKSYSPENISLMLDCNIEKIEKINHSEQPHY